jgi:hypothetical protein
LGLGATVAAQGALVRNLGGAAAQGYRPSLFSILSAPRIFAGAPMPVKVASVVTTGTVMLANKVGNTASPSEMAQLGKEYLQQPFERCSDYVMNKMFGGGPPPPPPGGTAT